MKRANKMSILALSSLFVLNFAGLTLAEDIIPDNTVAAVTDTTYPSDVKNLKAVAGDAKITLNWDASTDNVAVTGYKIFYGLNPVIKDTDSYTLGPIDAKNVQTFDVKGLENGKAYYFAVTAYDAAGNESEFYSNEASATPKAGAATSTPDTTAPKVLSATATYKNQVNVKFSEPVKLPLLKAEAAFSIKEDLGGVNLTVSKAEMDLSDKTGKSILLTTADQKKATKYILTAGIQIQDQSGNPIISGTSDTAVFTGTDAKVELKPAADTTPDKPADTTAPAFTKVEAVNSSTVEVAFSEPVVLLSNATENFLITDASDNTKIINVKKVSVTSSGSKVTLTTDNLDNKEFNLIAMKVKDAAGNTIPFENSATTFMGKAPAVTPDTNPVKENPDNTDVKNLKPVDAASDLVAKMVTNMIVNLTWKPASADKMAGVANFVLYMSEDRGVTYGEGVVLGKDIKSYDFNNLKQNMIYYFKLTTKDQNGNESEGLTTYFTLPATGPELGLLFFGSAGLSAFVTGKKRRKSVKK